MTPEDLDQIRGVVERVVEEKQTVNRGDLGRAMEAVADEFSEVRKEMSWAFTAGLFAALGAGGVCATRAMPARKQALPILRR